MISLITFNGRSPALGAAISASLSTHVLATLPTRYYVSNLAPAPSNFDQSINNYGQIATTLNGRPSLWTPPRINGVESGTWTTLPTPIAPPNPFGGGGTPMQGVALDINDYGQVAGNLGYADAAGRPYLWTPDVPNGSIGTAVLPMTTSAAAYGINNYGQLAIYQAGLNPNVLWTPTNPNGTSGATTQLNFNGGAFAINNRGDVGITHTQAMNHIFRPDEPNATQGTYVELPATLRSLNDQGWVAAVEGVYAASETGYVKVASSPTRAYALNNHNVAIADSSFVWSMQDGTINLNTRLERHSGARITVTSVWDINDLGQIVGTANFDPDNDPSTTNSVPRTILLTPLIAGDANIDQQVNFDDLLTLAQHYGTSGNQTWQSGDFDGNDVIDFDDLLALAQHYDPAPAAMSGGHFAADWAMARSLVPEPMSAAMLLFGFRRKRR